ncbi:hypothetical protein PR202_gb07963 [Eleusine coracana subsp. coracana]|uniref:Uncharacterized protein n=1 Tax=Eleusine coracana subsp. coracana TaxID=191504 RepID=A0AAV5EDN6_ELECO|nr:hypothetical protein PR202_gb07963 [Eleusine coracana subsp. coracana]
MARGQRKGLNTFIILYSWTIWKHRNAGVFDGSSPNIQTAFAQPKPPSTPLDPCWGWRPQRSRSKGVAKPRLGSVYVFFLFGKDSLFVVRGFKVICLYSLL